MKLSEHAIQTQILEYLAAHGIKAWRQNTGAAWYRNKDGSKRWISYGRKGQADITGLCSVLCEYFVDFDSATGGVRKQFRVDGARLEIECKAPGRKPTAEQQAFLDEITRAGGIGIWADSLTMLKTKLRASGVVLWKQGELGKNEEDSTQTGGI
jgi:hypothetical protein